MCKRSILKLIGVLIALCLLSAFCWAEEPSGTSSHDLTKAELIAIFDKLEANLTLKESLLNDLKANLKEKEQAYNDLKIYSDQATIELNSLKERIKNSEELLNEYKERTTKIESLLNEVANSLKSYEREIKWLKFKWKAAAVIGAIFGYEVAKHTNQ
jgi:chromosome segregation ATPase